MAQASFEELEHDLKKRRTRRELFLEKMDKLVPWEFYNLSHPGMEDLLYEVESVRRFVGLRLTAALPDETTILNFRHLLEKHGLGEGLFEEVNAHLASRGHRLRTGTIHDYPLDTSCPNPYIGNKEADMTTFYEFTQQFPDDEACLKRIMVERYGGTEFDCPKCGAHAKFYRLKRDRAFLCQHCKHHIYPCVGTPMERSRTPVHKWFYAMFLFTTSRHGVAAKELERQLGVTYKTAWRMGHEIRKYMAETDGEWPLGGPGGDVEVDETLVGGKVKGKGRGYRGNKTAL